MEWNRVKKKTAKITADKAYGLHRQELVSEMSRASLPGHLSPEIGQELEGRQDNGRIFKVTVVDLSDTTVTIDANHRLAGEDLTFDIELMEIL